MRVIIKDNNKLTAVIEYNYHNEGGVLIEIEKPENRVQPKNLLELSKFVIDSILDNKILEMVK